jgi:hypothetical protein|eukprot:3527609-Prymnesium_polylepis.1
MLAAGERRSDELRVERLRDVALKAASEAASKPDLAVANTCTVNEPFMHLCPTRPSPPCLVRMLQATFLKNPYFAQGFRPKGSV